MIQRKNIARETTGRDTLVLEHLGFAGRMARALHRTLPSYIDVEELEADAYLGLLKAAEGFDPARGAQFRTYAARRIHGQMLDGLRDRQQLRRRYTPDFVASLDTSLRNPEGQAVALVDTIAAPESPVGGELEAQDQLEALLRSCGDDRDASIVRGRAGGLSHRQIADQLGISTCTVSERLGRLRMVHQLSQN